jgi:glycosyltransferase involved in cell wall biosynthesis
MNIGMLLDKEFYGDLRVENEVQALCSAGYTVFVYCFTFDGKYKEGDYFGAKIIHIPVLKTFAYKLRGLTNTTFNFYPNYLVKLIENHIKNNNIGVFHVHDLFLFEAGLKLRELFPQIKLVGDLHENYVEGLKHYKFANTFPGKYLISIKKWEKSEIDWCNKYDYLITVIEEAVERYSSLGVQKDKMSVVANYVNLETFKIDDFDESITNKLNHHKTLTYVGGFDNHRGLESLISAIPKIVKSVKGFKLILVGSGRNYSDIVALSKTLRIENYISFEGWQSHKLLPSYIQASDMCIIPHLKTEHTDNTIPHKLFQYMLLKKPVLASNCKPIERIINEAKCGLIYRSNDADDLAQKAIKLFNHSEIKKFGENGYNAVITKYNWKETSKNLIDLYSSISKK